MINIVLVMTIWSWLWYHGRSIDKFSLQVLSIIYLPLLGASTFFSVLWLRRNTTEPRSCRTCKLRRMARVSKQTRYVTSKSEINWGYNDCIAALKEGCYKDAVKLLSELLPNVSHLSEREPALPMLGGYVLRIEFSQKRWEIGMRSNRLLPKSFAFSDGKPPLSARLSDLLPYG
jgi:hypothetical protein